MRKGALALGAVSIWLVAVLVFGCGDDPECEGNADCAEVVCPDGVKHRQCKDGACFRAEDCPPAPQGGW